jgi:transcription elongation factor GreA
MPRETQYLTPEGRKKLEDELEHLRTVRRREVAANLKRAIEEGDLRENAGYDESKRDQAMVEGRIRDIEAILANAEILEENGNHDVVAVGASVTVVEEGREPETYQIVGPAEADPVNGRISNESPIGKALLGHNVGDTVEFDTPGGPITLEITAVE